MKRKRILRYELLGAAIFAGAVCYGATSVPVPLGCDGPLSEFNTTNSRLSPDDISKVLRIARLPSRARSIELSRRPLEDVLDIARRALRLRWDLSHTRLASLDSDVVPTLEEMADRRNFPWLQTGRLPLSQPVQEGLARELLGRQVTELLDKTMQRLIAKATPEQRVGFARKLIGDLKSHGTGWLEQTRADQMIDAVLGLRSEEVTRKLQSQTDDEVKQKYGPEQTWFKFGNRNLLTPYFEFQNMLDFVKPQPGQTFVDIGSGMGRMGMYMGIMHPGVKCIGYEIVTERVKESQRVAAGLGLRDVKFYEQNLADPKFKPEAADIYYAFNPVSGPTFDKIIRDLKEQAVLHKKPFKLVVSGPAQYEKLEAESKWLKEITPPKRFEEDDFARVFSFDPSHP